MQTWIALLRGVNVGGHNRLPMKDLRTSMDRAGFHAPRTYIQSGNCVFESDEAEASALETRISELIRKDYGFETRLLVLKAEDFEKIAAAQPFTSEDSRQLHI